MAIIRAGSANEDTTMSPSQISPCSYAALRSGPVVVGRDADVVGDVDRLARCRAHLADHQPRPVVDRHVQQQVGEAQIGEQTAFEEELLEVGDVGARQRGVLPGQVTDRRHAPSVPTPSRAYLPSNLQIGQAPSLQLDTTVTERRRAGSWTERNETPAS